MDYSKQVPAAERTLNILEALSSAPDGLSATELLEQLGDISRSGLFALLNTLKARSYIEQSDNRGKYQLGPALWALLPRQSLGLEPLITAFETEMAQVDLGETAVLLWLDRQETVLLAQREGINRVRAVYRLGQREAATNSPGGRLLLAGLPNQSAQQTAVFNQFRSEGAATQETAETLDIACPICADGVQPSAALQVSLPLFRSQPAAVAQLKKQVQQAASRISFRLGAAVYQPYGWAVGEPIGPNRALKDAEIEQFLQGPWSARLACVRADGTPHVLPLWYEWDGRSFWVAASPGAQWKQVVDETGRVSLTIDEPWPPLRRAFVVGQAHSVAADAVPGGLAGLRQRLAVRYLGQGADQQPELCQIDGWTAVQITPQRLTGHQGLGRA
ncbi:MAG: pyridoxamine 5'-phosphate oxidase family protein [Ardenticatenaceae bacterium]|nr:pyridoxamine 5'-phosphate oxidase family protein [Ardenticatenaceae bacterium]MCB8975597.1 pyridoxamine 5'-phosphate oxidase family protein [Ardenticatenaceae bacterium]